MFKEQPIRNQQQKDLENESSKPTNNCLKVLDNESSGKVTNQHQENTEKSGTEKSLDFEVTLHKSNSSVAVGMIEAFFLFPLISFNLFDKGLPINDITVKGVYEIL